MNIRPYYTYKKDVFTAEFCDRVIEAGEKIPHDPIGAIGQVDAQAKLEIRSTELTFFPQKPEYKWIYDAMLPCVNGANASYWNFDLSAIEHAQYGIYNPGQFYGWHIDQHPNPYKDGPFKGLTRKLSFTLQLTDEDDYEGGDFELREPGEDNVVRHAEGTRARGSVIVFPSFVFHRVTPVTRGVRRSLVGWIVGPPFV